MTATVRCIFPMLSTEELQKSLSFLADLLVGHMSYGFRRRCSPGVPRPYPGQRGLDRDRSWPADRQPTTAPPASGHRSKLCVYVDDLDATGRATLRCGHQDSHGARRPGLGRAFAYVEDPDSNLVKLTK
jgi:hypothetical protein